MNIQQLQYIRAVVDFKNFDHAAQHCCVTQSTLSTMIGKFEDEIDIKIFNRKTKPVTITPEGQQLISRMRIIVNEIDLLNNLVQELKGEMKGVFKIGIIPTITPYLLPLFLNDFSDCYPQLKIVIKEMTTAEIQHALQIREIDAGILALPLFNKDLVETELYSEPFMIYDCTREQKQPKVAVHDLDYSKVYLLQEGHCLRTQVQQVCELSNQHSKTEVNFEFESGSMESLLRITQKRMGITIVPFLAINDLLNSDQYALREFESPVPTRKVGLVTHKFFVKKKILKTLNQVIKESVTHLIPAIEEEQILNPLR